jgi:hypothetical protein
MNSGSASSPGAVLTPQHRRDLAAAVDSLENLPFVARLADYAGQPVNAVTRLLPGRVNLVLRHVIRTTIYKCLDVAIASLDRGADQRPTEWGPKVMTGITGCVGGFFGLVALPVELPLTTTLMLRSIAEIARAEGEDMSSLEARLACIEVFALGGQGPLDKADVDYYAVRALLAKLTGEVTAYVLDRGAINASSPIIARLVGEVAGRFGLVLSERLAAGAVPIIGAVGSATVNVIFMDYFQRLARGHFIVRRLERIYGTAVIQQLYREALAASGKRKRRSSATPSPAYG